MKSVNTRLQACVHHRWPASLPPCLQNILDACVGALAFYLVGYGFAFGAKPGTQPNHVIGNWDFALLATDRAAREALEKGGSAAEFAANGWHIW